MINQADGAKKLVLTLHTFVNHPVLLKMFLQVNLSAGCIVTEATHLDGWNVFYIVYIQVTVSVNLLLEFSVTHMALMNDSSTPLATSLKE